MRLSVLVSVLVIAIFSQSLFAEEATEIDSDWKVVIDKNDVQVFASRDTQTKLWSFRGVGKVLFHSEEHALNTIHDLTGGSRWLAFVSEIREYAPPKDGVRHLQVLTFLPLVKDREALQLAHYTNTETDVILNLSHNTENLPKNPKYVRIPHSSGKVSFIQQENPLEYEVSYEITLNFGSIIPDRIANLIIRGAPYNSILNLRRLAQFTGNPDEFEK
jgi:hypothetical protein